MSIDGHGTSFQYSEVTGTTPIVFVHGVGLDQDIWRLMLAEFTGRSTLTYDLLGHGETSLALGAQSFQPFVDQLHGLLQGLGIPEMVLAGFSLGGQVAKHFASSHPDMVRALVVISATYQRTPEEREAMHRRVRQAKDGDQQGLQDAALQRWFSPGFLAANPDVERQITARLRNNDPARFLESYELLSNAEEHPLDYGSLPMPTLVLTGVGDPGSTPRMAAEMAQAMPNAQAKIIQGAKHLGIIEEHRQFSDAVIRFLAASEI
ncbi:MAG: alpha/beta fold hydrolase [Chloroflexi bacterium]|nr:alpha/beta fold hydrolase [Chloroflexota bacterium]